MSRKRGEKTSSLHPGVRKRQRAQNDEPVCRIFFCHRRRRRRCLSFVVLHLRFSPLVLLLFYPPSLFSSSVVYDCTISCWRVAGSKWDLGEDFIRIRGRAGEERRKRKKRRDRTAYPCDTDAPGNHSDPSLLINWHTYLFYSRKETCIPVPVPVTVDGGEGFGVRDERWE